MRVAILDDYQRVALDSADWASLGPGHEVVAFPDHLAGEAEVAERLAGFEAVVAMRERTPFPRSLLARLPELRLLVTTGMRNLAIDLDAARERGITVCGTGGLAAPTAELTWALVLALARQLPAEDANVRAGGWQLGAGLTLEGATIGIVGLGRMGSRVAAYARAFGMRLLAWSPNMTAEAAAEHGAELVPLDELLARSDVVTLHVVLGERSRGLIGARELALMKPTAYLVNTSRGPIVDESALLGALESGAIAGAGLDVYDREPLPAGHPLRRAPRTVVTPHLGYVTRESYAVFYGEACEDVAAWLRGEPVRVLT